MKNDPHRHLLESYPCVFEILPRYLDLDLQAHVTNTAVTGFHDEARVLFHRALFGFLQIEVPLGGLIARVEVDYLRETLYPEPVRAAVGVLEIGRKSYTLGSALFQNGVCTSLSNGLLVHFKEGRSAFVPEQMRALLDDKRIAGPPA